MARSRSQPARTNEPVVLTATREGSTDAARWTVRRAAGKRARVLTTTADPFEAAAAMLDTLRAKKTKSNL